MQTSLVLTVIGEDMPGLVESLSQVIADHDGNWVESSMARLEGKFAGIVRVTIEQDRVRGLAASLDALAAQGLKVTTEQSEFDTVDSRVRIMKLELVGGDRSGIVHDVSHALAQRQVNVEDLRTECANAPMSGKQLFKASARLRVPPGVDVDELRQALERIAGDLIVDIALGDVAPSDAPPSDATEGASGSE